jgi:Cu-processing system permease protein
MYNVVTMGLRGIFRDRVFQGIMVAAVLFLLIPTVSSLSMRQVTELSVTLSLSLVSFILLLLAVFLGGTSLWRDLDRRYTHSVLGLPLSRSSYLLGRFTANALFLCICSAVLCLVSFGVIFYVSTLYPPTRPIQWETIGAAICYDTLKYLLVVAVAFLFSTVSTSFFLPIFGTIAVLMAGNASQGVYDYLHSPALAKNIPHGVIEAANALYYLLPNFSSFDFKLNAVYGLPLPERGLLLTLGYFAIYGAILLTLSVLVFDRREMK